jgi:hypothetical protein
MGVHFYYNYKDDLAKRLKEHYAVEIDKHQREMIRIQQIDEAEQLIFDYFGRLAEELEEVVAVSNGAVAFEGPEGDTIVRFSINENFIRFTRRDKFIEVKIGRFNEIEDMVESSIIGYIIAGDKKAHTKRIGKIHEGGSFDDNTINQYLREAFAAPHKEE